jgi:hypothetical protein
LAPATVARLVSTTLAAIFISFFAIEAPDQGVAGFEGRSFQGQSLGPDA